MTDTQKRIAAYKAALPGLKEKVAAVALLLVMSVVMMTSATFAWLTISRAPEVANVHTTVASNGNLEIALASGDGTTPPAESAIGDSSANKNQSVVKSNLTWGNLVNLSDEAYGLQNLQLRPARLNRAALLTSPLYGAVYTPDGRIEKLNSSFAFAIWQPEQDGKPADFVINRKDVGVRAISSVTIEARDFALQVYNKREDADTANNMAGEAYLAITTNRAWMDSLGIVMGTYLTAELNNENPAMENKDVQNMRDVFGAFIGVYDIQIDAMVKLLNYQLFLQNNTEEGSTPYDDYTREKLMEAATTEAALKRVGLRADGLDQLKKDYAMLQTNWELMKTLADKGSVTYNDMKDVTASLVNVGTCTINGKSVDALSADKSEAAAMVMDRSTKTAVITNGVLYNFEKLNGTHCDVRGLSVPARYIISVTVKANITTNAPIPHQFFTCMEYADSMNKGAQGEEYAQDTYGLALDLWVRTNAPGSVLTLEGNVLTEETQEYPTTRNADGEERDLYVLNLEREENGETVSYTRDLYQEKADDGTITWYDAKTHTALTEENLNGKTPVRKVIIHETVIGFEGENRVWEEKAQHYLFPDSTTQGSGSCYVYYADTPEDQARSLALLESFQVAFSDEDGNLLATAIMDTEHHYAANGRVTVPLVLDTNSGVEFEDSLGISQRGIMALQQNVPTRITAIVYLDGTELDNADVLAASDINGQLNIQFGTSEVLHPIKDEVLYNKERKVSATVTPDEFNYDTATGKMISTVTVNVEGDAPSKVTATFIRAISATQGSREDRSMTFTEESEGKWTSQYEFTSPGTYILRSVQLDGVDYDLAEPPKVEISGFAIKELSMTGATGDRLSVMTAASSTTVDLSLKFATEDIAKMPKSVQGRFLRSEDGAAVNVDFTYSSTGYWNGTARFLLSGEYKLLYLVLDGEYVEIPESFQKTADVTLGMQVEVYTDSPVSFKYVPSELEDNQKNLYMKVRILDNTDNQMGSLQNATLYYAKQGTSLAEAGMSAPLKWDAASGYYTCTFASKIGMYYFNYVVVEGNTISKAKTAPSFRIMSPEPPVFNSGATVAYQYAPKGTNTAQLAVLIDKCESATIFADVTCVKGATTTTMEIEGSLVDGKWVFPIPADGNGNRDGVWTITQLRLSDVYDTDGKEYTQDNPLVFDMTGEEKVSAKVISTVNVKFETNKSKDFTGNGMLTPYALPANNGLNVKFTDYDGKPLYDDSGNYLISNVSLILEHTGGETGMVEYGGYYKDGFIAAEHQVVIPLDSTTDGSLFAQSTDAQLLYAGKYKTTLSYQIGKNTTAVTVSSTDTANWPENGPVFTVRTVKPTVTVDDISPKGNHATVNSNKAQINVTSTMDDYNVRIYPEAVAKEECGTTTGDIITEPTVTLRLTGIGSANSAVLTFTTNIDEMRLYANSGRNGTDAYTWDQNSETVQRYVGYYAGGCDEAKAAGILTSSNELVVKVGEDEYLVPITQIIIDNSEP